ncbi:MAG: LuxR C-terminal-related transcriptional regulator [Deinococcota bacterium]
MSSFILASKLNQPQVQPELVSRQRLLTKLDTALTQQLSFVSASAGFGKTTLVSQWLAHLDRPVAWLSLDTTESSPSQFVRYLLASFQTVYPDVGAGMADILEVKQDVLAVLASVINDLAALPEPFVVVLDDFHLINTQDVNALLEQVSKLCNQLISQAQHQKRITSLIELLMLRTRIQLAQGHQPQALTSLNEALVLAEPEGFRHVFFEEGPMLVPLLKEASSSSTFAASLLMNMEPSPNYPFPAIDGLLEPLSEHELEVLRLLPTGRSSPNLASYLHISVNTVKTHLKNIYSKLGVHRRHEAVARAQELEII